MWFGRCGGGKRGEFVRSEFHRRVHQPRQQQYPIGSNRCVACHRVSPRVTVFVLCTSLHSLTNVCACRCFCGLFVCGGGFFCVRGFSFRAVKMLQALAGNTTVREFKCNNQKGISPLSHITPKPHRARTDTPPSVVCAGSLSAEVERSAPQLLDRNQTLTK